MKKRTTPFYTLLLFIFLSLGANGQSNSALEKPLFNLAPGVVAKKNVKIDDLSFKLSEIQYANQSLNKTEVFLYQYSLEELESMSKNAPDSYKYYMKANEFYIDLSNKVKNVFSIYELWDIYIFDEVLKIKLESIN